MSILIQLVIAHLLGDFVFQPGKWVVAKEKNKAGSIFLYLHILIHFVLILILTGGIHYILPALAITATHLAIDLLKLYLQNEKTARAWFFIDQLLHIAVILLVFFLWINTEKAPLIDWQPEYWKFVLAGIFVTKPVSILISMMLQKWSIHSVNQQESLSGAGNYIGILERLLIITFIAIGEWGGVGFLLGAKSIFRFGDLTNSKDRKLTEYILIGTLLSFGIAIAAGIILMAAI